MDWISSQPERVVRIVTESPLTNAPIRVPERVGVLLTFKTRPVMTAVVVEEAGVVVVQG